MNWQLMHSTFVDARRRYILIVGIFDALDRSGVRPVTAKALHAIWYLTNALAPAWGIKPFDAALLKTARQPYFPSLQSDLERLVGMGMLLVSSLSSGLDSDRLQAKFELNRVFSDRILMVMKKIDEEADILLFLDQVVQASSRFGEAEQEIGLTKDATYGDPAVDINNVIDLGEWLDVDQITPTESVFQRISEVCDRELKPAELMDIYVDHLRRRYHHG